MKIFRRLFYVFLSFIIALNTMGLIVYANETHSAENSHKQCALDETPDDQILSGNDPYVTVFVTNTYITDSSGTKYKYNVFLNTNAGDLGYVSGTKFTSLYVRTGVGGTLLFSKTNYQYSYSGISYHSKEIGSFYRSISNPLTSVYANTAGALVYDYQNGWSPANDYYGTITLNSYSAYLSDR